MHEINQDLPVENEFYMDSNYRPLLLRISNHITKANLEKLKFLCSDAIEEGELEEINSPLKLFKALERRQLLAIDELSLLRGLLISVECIQLVRELDDFISRREVELLGLKRLSQKRKQGTLCRKNHPSAEPDCRETGLAAACEYDRGTGPLHNIKFQILEDIISTTCFKLLLLSPAVTDFKMVKDKSIRKISAQPN